MTPPSPAPPPKSWLASLGDPRARRGAVTAEAAPPRGMPSDRRAPVALALPPHYHAPPIEVQKHGGLVMVAQRALGRQAGERLHGGGRGGGGMCPAGCARAQGGRGGGGEAAPRWMLALGGGAGRRQQFKYAARDVRARGVGLQQFACSRAAGAAAAAAAAGHSATQRREHEGGGQDGRPCGARRQAGQRRGVLRRWRCDAPRLLLLLLLLSLLLLGLLGLLLGRP